MNDIDDHDKKQGQAARKLELKKTVETGQVRQSFAHGRSKMVTVEVRKKRTYSSDPRRPPTRRARRTAAAGSPFAGAARADGKPREGAAIGLTSQEKAARVRALQDAMQAEADRQAMPEPAAPVDEAVAASLVEEALQAEAAAAAETPAEIAAPSG